MPKPSSLFADQLNEHQIAYLKALAQDRTQRESAERALFVRHGSAARVVHRATVQLAREVVRRRGDGRWRLIGVEALNAEASASAQFALATPESARKIAQHARLCARYRLLLEDLARHLTEGAQPADRVGAWFAPMLADQLRARGLNTLGALRTYMRTTPRWWGSLEAIGPLKARRVQSFVDELLKQHPVPPGEEQPPGNGASAIRAAAAALAAVERAQDAVRPSRDWAAAIQAWIDTRAAAATTARLYARELLRFRLWLALQQGRALDQATPEDCQAYAAFLRAVPTEWIANARSAHHMASPAPFRGQPSEGSQRLALDVVAACFAWLRDVGHLSANPWAQVARSARGPAAAQRGELDSPTRRAFSDAAWQALWEQIEEDAKSKRARDQGAAHRNRWLLQFGEACGLQPGELLAAKVGDLQETEHGWVLRVPGATHKDRTIPIPAAALRATRTYLESRGMGLDAASADLPLLGALGNPRQAPSYSALAQTLKALALRAAKRLPSAQARQMQKASTLWLRHTHATRAAQRGVPIPVLQENLGQADPRRTARYYRQDLGQRAQAIEDAFGGSKPPAEQRFGEDVASPQSWEAEIGRRLVASSTPTSTGPDKAKPIRQQAD